MNATAPEPRLLLNVATPAQDRQALKDFGQAMTGKRSSYKKAPK